MLRLLQRPVTIYIIYVEKCYSPSFLYFLSFFRGRILREFFVRSTGAFSVSWWDQIFYLFTFFFNGIFQIPGSDIMLKPSQSVHNRGTSLAGVKNGIFSVITRAWEFQEFTF